jgi:serine/threonine protein kinase
VLAERYRLIKLIGQGAFGAVFLMEDLMINEEVILRLLSRMSSVVTALSNGSCTNYDLRAKSHIAMLFVFLIP